MPRRVKFRPHTKLIALSELENAVLRYVAKGTGQQMIDVLRRAILVYARQLQGFTAAPFAEYMEHEILPGIHRPRDLEFAKKQLAEFMTELDEGWDPIRSGLDLSPSDGEMEFDSDEDF